MYSTPCQASLHLFEDGRGTSACNYCLLVLVVENHFVLFRNDSQGWLKKKHEKLIDNHCQPLIKPKESSWRPDAHACQEAVRLSVPGTGPVCN